MRDLSMFSTICGCRFVFKGVPGRFARDSRWSETGDRYIIKLFRDYVFHQVDERGRPVLSLSHVLSCLNKASEVLALLDRPN